MMSPEGIGDPESPESPAVVVEVAVVFGENIVGDDRVEVGVGVVRDIPIVDDKGTEREVFI